jgi:hypothetical protein
VKNELSKDVLFNYFFLHHNGVSANCPQRSRLAAVLAFEKQSARQPKPIRIIDD